MSDGKLSDEALLAFLRENPGLRNRIASMAVAVEGEGGELKEADAAEERMVEEMRVLGREALKSWAEKRVAATEQAIRRRPGMHRQGKKTLLAYEARRDSGSGAAISLGKASRASVCERGEGPSLGLLAAAATRHRRLRRRSTL
jgi:hypothetical protein